MPQHMGHTLSQPREYPGGGLPGTARTPPVKAYEHAVFKMLRNNSQMSSVLPRKT
ncbi:MAG: hypothetical protein J7L73_08605 [Anaerolineales bacterium]|nr:hypothetical protein [Anaerolineales bacterium]